MVNMPLGTAGCWQRFFGIFWLRRAGTWRFCTSYTRGKSVFGSQLRLCGDV